MSSSSWNARAPVVVGGATLAQQAQLLAQPAPRRSLRRSLASAVGGLARRMSGSGAALRRSLRRSLERGSTYSTDSSTASSLSSHSSMTSFSSFSSQSEEDGAPAHGFAPASPKQGSYPVPPPPSAAASEGLSTRSAASVTELADIAPDFFMDAGSGKKTGKKAAQRQPDLAPLDPDFFPSSGGKVVKAGTSKKDKFSAVNDLDGDFFGSAGPSTARKAPVSMPRQHLQQQQQQHVPPPPGLTPPPGLAPAGSILAATKNGRRAAEQLCLEITFDAPDRSGRAVPDV
jgi:hypothetical protein